MPAICKNILIYVKSFIIFFLKLSLRVSTWKELLYTRSVNIILDTADFAKMMI